MNLYAWLVSHVFLALEAKDYDTLSDYTDKYIFCDVALQLSKKARRKALWRILDS